MPSSKEIIKTINLQSSSPKLKYVLRMEKANTNIDFFFFLLNNEKRLVFLTCLGF